MVSFAKRYKVSETLFRKGDFERKAPSGKHSSGGCFPREDRSFLCGTQVKTRVSRGRCGKATRLLEKRRGRTVLWPDGRSDGKPSERCRSKRSANRPWRPTKPYRNGPSSTGIPIRRKVFGLCFGPSASKPSKSLPRKKGRTS